MTPLTVNRTDGLILVQIGTAGHIQLELRGVNWFDLLPKDHAFLVAIANSVNTYERLNAVAAGPTAAPTPAREEP